MAAALTLQVAPHTGLSPIVLSSIGSGGLAQTGNTTPCGPGVALLIENDGATMDVRLTVPAALTFDGLGIANAVAGTGYRVVTVTSTFMALIPLVAATYMDPATNLATFGFSATPTSVNVACVYISA